MSGGKGGVTTAAGQAKRAKLVESVISGLSVTEAAQALGVSRRHGYRLLEDPKSRAEIAKAAEAAASGAKLVLQRGAEEAARALVGMGTGRIKATPARVAACRGVLDYAVERAASTLNVSATRAPTAEAFEAMGAAALDAVQRALAEADAAEAATVPTTVDVSGATPVENAGEGDSGGGDDPIVTQSGEVES